jgi:signal peptidase II
VRQGKNSYVLFFVISTAVFLLDQITKYLIRSHLRLAEVITVFSFFSVVYVDNTGSAFGMLKSLGNPFFISVAAAAIIVIAVMIVKARENRLALSLILGGAAGNLSDRIVHGYVVDFLDFSAGGHHWPAFNIADSALTVGITLLVIDMVFHRSERGRPVT